MSRVRKARLPNDTAGILEDRIEDDSLDFQAYTDLITHFRSKSKTDEARHVYEKLVKVLPASAYVWRQYAEMEASENELNRVEALFNRALMSSLHLDIWNYYLDYIRRTHPLSTGGSSARSVISQAYEFVLQHVGIDLESGPVWADYLTFLKSAPATSTWEEQQRNDQLRKAYHRAVVIPLNNVEFLWREYNAFENGINKQTARKFLNEKSPAYMTARAMAKELGPLLSTLRADNLPIRNESTFVQETYLSGWIRWLSLEKSDPLELEDQTQLRNRIKYAYKQCLMYCRFFPQMWYDAAVYFDSLSELESVQEATQTKPSATLKEGLTANPASWLLSFAYAEVEEAAQRHENVKSTYDALLATNEANITTLEAEYKDKLETLRQQDNEASIKSPDDGDAESDSGSDSDTDDQQATETEKTGPTVEKNAAVKRLENERDAAVSQLSQEGTIAAIMYMRALRRMEGIKAARLCFANSIRSSYMSWQIYVASALMEHQYDDGKAIDKDGKAAVPIPVRIFTRGLKLFPENVDYILQYLNFLLGLRDDKNARALFEQTTAKLDPIKARPLFTRWYEYESMYGDLTSAQKLAARIDELDKTSNALSLFGQRYSYLGCDPIARRDLKQASLKQQPVPGSLPVPQAGLLPPPPIPGQPGSVPPGFNPPILPQYQRFSPTPAPTVLQPPPPPPLHPALTNLIQVLPPSSTFDGRITFDHQEMMRLLSTTDISNGHLASRASPVASRSRQATPQVMTQPAPVIPAKRTAQSMLPTPDDVVALGRHNDPRDPYRKKM